MSFIHKIVFLVFLFGVGVQSLAQKEVPIKNFQINGLFKSEIGPVAFGTSGYGGAHFSHYFTKNIGTEISIGYPSAGAKIQIYPWQIRRGEFRPYIGLAGSYFYHQPTIGSKEALVYVPIGLTWFMNLRWNISADVGPSRVFYPDLGNVTVDYIPVHFSIKLGYRIALVRFKKREKQIDIESIPDPN